MAKKRSILSRIAEFVFTAVIVVGFLALFIGGFFNHELWGWLLGIILGGSAIGCLWMMTSSEYNPW